MGSPLRKWVKDDVSILGFSDGLADLREVRHMIELLG